MTTYTVTTLNWNSAIFWSGVNESGTGHALDFTSLPSTYSVNFDTDSRFFTISDGTTTFTVGESGYSGARDATLGGTSLLDYFGVYTGAGNDSLIGDADGDSLVGGEGKDILSGGDGDDTLLTGSGIDYAYGDADADLIIVQDGFGDDTLEGGESITTGLDNDSIDMSDLSSGVVVQFESDEAGTITDGADTIKFSEFESFVLTDQNDSLDAINVSMDLYVDAGGGDDVIKTYGDDGSGSGNVDTIDGGDGDDTISSGGADDVIFGGAGADVIYSGMANDGAGDTVFGGAGNDQIDSYDHHTASYSSVGDLVDGGAGNDKITGTDDVTNSYQGDTLYGGTGDDKIDAKGGDDTVIGGDGDDTLFGGAGDDWIEGDQSATSPAYYVTDEGAVYTYDTETGSSTYLSTTQNSYGDIALSAEGTLYGAVFFDSDASGIYQIDPASGMETLVYDLPDDGESYASLTIGPDGNMYLVSDSTGVVSQLEPDGSGGFTNNGDVGTVLTGTADIVFVDADTAWATTGGIIFEYDVDGAGNFSISTNHGSVNGQSDIFGLTKGADGKIYAFEGTGEVLSTDPTVVPLTWSTETSVTLPSGSLWGASGVFEADGTGGGDDSIDGGDGDDTIDGGVGSDTLFGGLGADEITAGDDDDDLVLGAGDTADGGSGDDHFYLYADQGTGGTVIITGGEGDEGGMDLTNGSDGDDLRLDWDGTGATTTFDYVLSTSGDESGSVTGGATDVKFSEIERITSGDGDDALDLSSDTTGMDVVANAGNDTVTGGKGANWVDLGADKDTFLAQNAFGDDTIIGGETGADGDTVDLSAVSTGVKVVYSGSETGTITDGDDTISFSEIERLILTDANDSVDATGANSGVSIKAGDGQDTLIGATNGVYDDSLDGGAGDDSIVGGFGYDYLIGGDGNDTIDAGDAGDTIYAGDGNDVIEAGEELTVGDDDLIYAGGGDDTVTSVETDSRSQDTIYGEAGDDNISVTGGDTNLLDGGTGSDTLTSGTGSDTLSGGADDDSLSGGTGDDLLSGGTGDDTFSYSVGDGDDTISDFNTGNTGGLDDGDATNNDFVDLSAFYDHISELYADYANDGILNQNITLDSRGQAVDFSDNAQFGAGSLSITGQSADASSFTQENTGVACFTKGTAIATPQGDVLIEDLMVGDLVSTLDNGPQMIVWIGQRFVSAAEMAQRPDLRPVRIQRGVLNNKRRLIVSRQHGMLITDDNLARAVHLTRHLRGVGLMPRGSGDVTYIHLMCESHQILFAEGAPTESFYPGKQALGGLDAASKQHVLDLLPNALAADPFSGTFRPARPFANPNDLRRLLFEKQRRTHQELRFVTLDHA